MSSVGSDHGAVGPHPNERASVNRLNHQANVDFHSSNEIPTRETRGSRHEEIRRDHLNSSVPYPADRSSVSRLKPQPLIASQSSNGRLTNETRGPRYDESSRDHLGASDPHPTDRSNANRAQPHTSMERPAFNPQGSLYDESRSDSEDYLAPQSVVPSLQLRHNPQLAVRNPESTSIRSTDLLASSSGPTTQRPAPPSRQAKIPITLSGRMMHNTDMDMRVAVQPLPSRENRYSVRSDIPSGVRTSQHSDIMHPRRSMYSKQPTSDAGRAGYSPTHQQRGQL